nr:hypothetical protein [Armatimonas sp.]
MQRQQSNQEKLSPRTPSTSEALYQVAERLEQHTHRKPVFEGLLGITTILFICLALIGSQVNNLSIAFVGVATALLASLGLCLYKFQPGDRPALLQTTTALLEELPRTELPGLLRVLQALEQGRESASKQERQVRRAALSLLGHHLARVPRDELDTLTQSDRHYLLRELERRLKRLRNSKLGEIELPIRLFLVLGELQEPGAESLADKAKRHPDERLRAAAREYQKALAI